MIIIGLFFIFYIYIHLLYMNFVNLLNLSAFSNSKMQNETKSKEEWASVMFNQIAEIYLRTEYCLILVYFCNFINNINLSLLQIFMSSFPSQSQTNIHQFGLTTAWSILLNVSIICGALRYNKIAGIAHAVFGFIILILTYFCILYILVPFGFNISLQAGNLLYAHAIIGFMMLGFVVIQVVGGVLAIQLQQQKKTSILILKYIRTAHRWFGYFMALLYKINILMAQYFRPYVFTALLVWECLWIITWVAIKLFLLEMQSKIVDSQTIEYLCTEIERTDKIAELTNNRYIIFANYVYESKELEETHPGGYKVIQLMRGREVDRFIYGMYSPQLLPELPAHSHSAYSLQLIGRPIAKLVSPPTYQGLTADIIEAEINYKSVVSQKTKIYSLGISPKYDRIRYLGYTDSRQLGQYYSFTLIQKITRIYTSVNFLNSRNIELMSRIFQLKDNFMKKTNQNKKVKVETELTKLLKNNNQTDVKQQLKDNNSQQQTQDSYIPIMLKVYNTGKLTKALKSVDFLNTSVKISIPRGRGLQLQSTKPGRIIIVAGGTGLFPFSDLIDLLFKAQLIAKDHQMKSQILRNDPLLSKEPFEKYFFVFLIAINQPQDIHPITLSQLVALSQHQKRVKIVLRVSQNAQKLKGKSGNIQMTREYFNKRVLVESSISGFSRVWICGPPKLNTDTASILLQNGYSNDDFLLI